MNAKTLKIVGYVAIAIMVLNVGLFAFRVISPLWFWVVLVIGAVFGYLVLPKLRKR